MAEAYDAAGEPSVCAGCADDVAARQTHWCCGEPHCPRCYQRHQDEEHTSGR